MLTEMHHHGAGPGGRLRAPFGNALSQVQLGTSERCHDQSGSSINSDCTNRKSGLNFQLGCNRNLWEKRSLEFSPKTGINSHSWGSAEISRNEFQKVDSNALASVSWASHQEVNYKNAKYGSTHVQRHILYSLLQNNLS